MVVRVPNNVINFYIDDSGTRHPDHDPGKRAKHEFDWFAPGGVLVKDSDEPQALELVRAPPDGYTLLLANGANAVSATLYEKLSFDFIRDIAPVAAISREPERPTRRTPSMASRILSIVPTLPIERPPHQPAKGVRISNCCLSPCVADTC